MNRVRDIQKEFAFLGPGRYSPVHWLPSGSPGWVFRDGRIFGVAVPCSEELNFSEKFAGTALHSRSDRFEGETRHLLRLECSKESLRNEFAVVCAQFLDPGPDESGRRLLETDPAQWWSRWRELLGNTNRERAPYSVLGELLALEKVRLADASAMWMGPKSSSHDIEATHHSYEVKSTLSRYGSVVHIAGHHQLSPSGDKALHLVHYRFEPDPEGDSINAALIRLGGMKLDMEELNSLLDRCGIEEGSVARNTPYRILEARNYDVDVNFPRITPQTFLGGALPPGIVKVEYDVDLSTLEGTEFQ